MTRCEHGVSRRIGILVFVNVVERWKIKKSAWPLLLGCSPSTTRKWIKAAKSGEERVALLKPDVQVRIAHLLSTYDGLHRLFGDGTYADAWIHTVNHAFGDQTPLKRILSGRLDDLCEVRLYVEHALNDPVNLDDQPQRLPINVVIAELVRVLGRKTVTYIAGLNSVRELATWLHDDGAVARSDRETVLRSALEAVRYIESFESASSAAAWFIGNSSLFDFESPASVLRDRGLDGCADIVRAAHAFVADASAAAQPTLTKTAISRKGLSGDR